MSVTRTTSIHFPLSPITNPNTSLNLEKSIDQDTFQAPLISKSQKISFSHSHVNNPLHRAMDPSIVDSLFGAPCYNILKTPDVLKALNQLSSAIEGGEFDVNAPIMGHHYSRYGGYPPLAAAAREANAELVKTFLSQRGINLGARDNRRQDLIPHRTVLMNAVRGAIDHENLDALKILLEDPRIQNTLNDTARSTDGKLEYTALDFALDGLKKDRFKEPHASIARLLIEKGAKAHHHLLDAQSPPSV